jgi:hypothetical protein
LVRPAWAWGGWGCLLLGLAAYLVVLGHGDKRNENPRCPKAGGTPSHPDSTSIDRGRVVGLASTNVGITVTLTVVRASLGYTTSLPTAEFRSVEKLLDAICRGVLPPVRPPRRRCDARRRGRRRPRALLSARATRDGPPESGQPGLVETRAACASQVITL